MKNSWRKWRAVKGEKSSCRPPLDRWDKRTQTCKVWCRALNALMMRAVNEGFPPTKSVHSCPSSLFPQGVLNYFCFTAAGLAWNERSNGLFTDVVVTENLIGSLT